MIVSSDSSRASGRRTGRRVLQGLATLALVAGATTAFGAASATAAPTNLTYGAGTHTLHLPAGPVTVSFTVLAAGGGADGDRTNAGGFGGGIVGSFVWTGKATTVKVVVGKAGPDGRPAGTCPTLFQNPAFHTGFVAGHGGAGGAGGRTGWLTCAGAGGFGGGATAVVLGYTPVLVTGGGGGGSATCPGADGTGLGDVKGLVAGGNGKAGTTGQEGGGGGGGGAVKAAGGASGVCGRAGTGYAHSSGGFVLGSLIKGTSSGLFGGAPGADGSAQFTGVGIS